MCIRKSEKFLLGTQLLLCHVLLHVHYSFAGLTARTFISHRPGVTIRATSAPLGYTRRAVQPRRDFTARVQRRVPDRKRRLRDDCPARLRVIVCVCVRRATCQFPSNSVGESTKILYSFEFLSFSFLVYVYKNFIFLLLFRLRHFFQQIYLYIHIYIYRLGFAEAR